MYTHNMDTLTNMRTILSCIPFILILISIQSVFFVPLYYNLISQPVNNIDSTENINITIISNHKYEYLISHNDTYMSDYTNKLQYSYNIDIIYPIYFIWISHDNKTIGIHDTNEFSIYLILNIRDKVYKYIINPTIYTIVTINRISHYNLVFNTIYSYKQGSKYGLSISLNHIY